MQHAKMEIVTSGVRTDRGYGAFITSVADAPGIICTLNVQVVIPDAKEPSPSARQQEREDVAQATRAYYVAMAKAYGVELTIPKEGTGATFPSQPDGGAHECD